MSQAASQRTLDQLPYFELRANVFLATSKGGKQANAASKAALRGVRLP